jgi:ATP-dependent RNA helicase DDX56/DBP9
MVLYAILKLKFLAGRGLILCNNVENVYKVTCFLQRIGITQLQLYNHTNPKNIKYYTMSTFNSGAANLLVSTAHIF